MRARHCAVGVAAFAGVMGLAGCMAASSTPSAPLPDLEVRADEGEAVAFNWEGDAAQDWTADVGALGSVWVIYEVCDSGGSVEFSVKDAFGVSFDCDGVVNRRMVVSDGPLSELDVSVSGDAPRWQVVLAKRPSAS